MNFETLPIIVIIIINLLVLLVSKDNSAWAAAEAAQ
jgi:hypothetical protein